MSLRNYSNYKKESTKLNKIESLMIRMEEKRNTIKYNHLYDKLSEMYFTVRTERLQDFIRCKIDLIKEQLDKKKSIALNKIYINTFERMLVDMEGVGNLPYHPTVRFLQRKYPDIYNGISEIFQEASL